jgi:hypothetical protein
MWAQFGRNMAKLLEDNFIDCPSHDITTISFPNLNLIGRRYTRK